MCGIVGIYAQSDGASSVDREELRAMRDFMARRGPDGSGEWISADARVGFGHRRLAIIDLDDRAAQPMRSADGRYTITFNGEIYNFEALRTELKRAGHTFRTTSDTEVLLALYADRGVRMFAALRGMYAFALWDEAERNLVLARDPYGIKPLYFAHEAGTLRFASQVRALLAGGGVSRVREPAGQVGFYLWGSVPEPFTTFRAIRAVPAGTYLVASARGVSAPQRHFSMAAAWSEASDARVNLPPTAARARVQEALRDSVRHHLVADVPVSVFLSAGVDSGALLGLMTERAGNDVHAVTLAFDEFANQREDEAPLAAELARFYGAEHHVWRVSERDFQAGLPAFFEAMDQPSIDGLNTWLVSRAAANLGLKVAISGLGGDELFGGYPSFRDVPRLVRAMAAPARVPGLGVTVRNALAPILRRVPKLHPKLAGVVELGGSYAGAYTLKRGLFLPWELEHVLPRDVVEAGLAALSRSERLCALLRPEPGAPWAKVAVLEASQYMRNQLLRDADWASMAHSVEVRVPLVDHVLLRELAPILVNGAHGAGKLALAASPERPLPERVRDRRKTGFSTPIARWLSRSADLDAYRRVPALAHDSCPWSRRFAYSVAQRLAQ